MLWGSTINLLQIFWIGLSIGTGFVCLCTLAGFLGRKWWIFDIASHFRVQYFFILVASALFYLLGDQIVALLISLLFALLNFFLIASSFSRSLVLPLESNICRLLLANVHQENQEREKLCRIIQSVRPDFIVLVEVNQAWINALYPALSSYPYSHTALREDNYGVAVFSQKAIQAAEVRYFSSPLSPTVIARVQVNEKDLTIIGTHPPPPKGRINSQHRNQHLQKLAEFAAAQPGEVMICGDINLTPWSPYFKQLLVSGDLKDSRRGFGMQASWPARRPYLWIPIDHILVSAGIQVQNRKLGPAIGSDHFPVILEFIIKTREKANQGEE